jgi:hypothetical protein
VNKKRIKSILRFSIQYDKEKLLVLQKTFTELLNKQFIQVSNSFAAVTVLFIWKSEDELQFCELLWFELNHLKIVIFFH